MDSRTAAYDPETIAALIAVLNQTIAELPPDKRGQKHKSRLASNILGAASIGERDPVRLKAAALAVAPEAARKGPARPPIKQRRRPTGSLFFVCPKTSQQTPAGIATDVRSLRASWRKTLKVKCPHCGDTHQISVREAFIEEALRSARGPAQRDF